MEIRWRHTDQGSKIRAKAFATTGVVGKSDSWHRGEKNEVKVTSPFCRLEALETLNKQLTAADDRSTFIQTYPVVTHFFSQNPAVANAINAYDRDTAFLLTLPIALGQGKQLYGNGSEWDTARCQQLVALLADVERTYAPIGGVIGYHLTLMRLLEEERSTNHDEWFAPPPTIDISDGDCGIQDGLDALPIMAEIYPIGGAGDRLNLYASDGVTPLPAAMLPFCGRTLLELLIRDLQAREYLYYKVKGKQTAVPIVLMTSHEKKNDAHIADILEAHGWFGRSPDDFFTFVQPLVPVITIEGEWAMRGALEPIVKPGGHGILWRCAIESGAFDWLSQRGCRKALIRQINNPIGGCDGALLAFTGIGCKGDHAFGFASCPRRVGTAEGMNALRITRDSSGYHYAITNIEYTDFKKKNISDDAAAEGGLYSRFPANSNILFADLAAIREAESQMPLPGLIANMKTAVKAADGREVAAGRLESTMQNIADAIINTFPEKVELPSPLRTFLTRNLRNKTLVTTKRAYDGTLLETPPGCYYELLGNHHTLFSSCGMALPDMSSEQQYIKEGAPFHLLFHPALGPLWSIIRQKVRGGRLAYGGELQLEITELYMEEVDIAGSLLIEATAPLGVRDSKGNFIYGEGAGKCWLERVTIRNDGIDRGATKDWWKNACVRHESLHIVIHGDGEFVARDVTFRGDERIEVPAATRLTARQNRDGEVTFTQEAITAPSWFWRYSYKNGTPHLTIQQR